MKKSTPKLKTKLALRTQVIRVLDAAPLTAAAGGVQLQVTCTVSDDRLHHGKAFHGAPIRESLFADSRAFDRFRCSAKSQNDDLCKNFLHVDKYNTSLARSSSRILRMRLRRADFCVARAFLIARKSR